MRGWWAGSICDDVGLEYGRGLSLGFAPAGLCPGLRKEVREPDPRTLCMSGQYWSGRTAGPGRWLPRSTPGSLNARRRRAGVGTCSRLASTTTTLPVPPLPCLCFFPCGRHRVRVAVVTRTICRSRCALTMRCVVVRSVPRGGDAAAQRARVRDGNSLEPRSAALVAVQVPVGIRHAECNTTAHEDAYYFPATVKVVLGSVRRWWFVRAPSFGRRRRPTYPCDDWVGGLQCRSERRGKRRGCRVTPQAHNVYRTETLRDRATRQYWKCAYELLVFLDGAARRGRMSSPQVVEVSYAVVDVSCAVRDIRAPLRLLFAGWLTRVWLHGAVATRCAPRTCSMQCVCLMRYRSAPALQLCPPRTARDFDRQMRVATRSVATE